MGGYIPSTRSERVEMLRAKKTNEQIESARKRGLRTDFNKSREFLKGEFHAKK